MLAIPRRGRKFQVLRLPREQLRGAEDFYMQALAAAEAVSVSARPELELRGRGSRGSLPGAPSSSRRFVAIPELRHVHFAP